MKGIILAGGAGTRLHPVTKTTCKQLLPIYDKPMIYYSLSTLMLSNIRDILIITTPRDIDNFKGLLGDGKNLGLDISYATQTEPRGLADAFIVGEKFIGKDSVCLMLGDNILYGSGLQKIMSEAMTANKGATVFGYHVPDPERYGIVEFDKSNKVLSLEEKPVNPKSHHAIIGLYYYENSVVDIAKNIAPSPRGELEITDINISYLNENKLKVKILGRGFAWLDTGTHESMLDAALFVKTIEERQGLKIGCPEEIALRNEYISEDEFLKQVNKMANTSYKSYLKNILAEFHLLN